MSKFSRRIMMIDKRVQGLLALRVGLYWLICLFVVFVVMAIIPIALMMAVPVADSPSLRATLNSSLQRFWPLAAVSGVMLPFIIMGVIEQSNRFVGPMHRVRTLMRDIAAGGDARPIKFRDNDYWRDFAEDFNGMVARLRAAESEAKLDGGEERSEDQPSETIHDELAVVIDESEEEDEIIMSDA